MNHKSINIPRSEETGYVVSVRNLSQGTYPFCRPEGRGMYPSQTIKFTLIIGLAFIFTFNSCTRSKGSSETAPQTETPEASTATETATPETAQETVPTIEPTTTTRENIDLKTILNKQETEFLGGFGDDFYKIGIVFTSITKKNNSLYEVTGKSKLKGNICDFKGTMEVESSKESVTDYGWLIGIDGHITGKYLFEEDRNQPETGRFEGTFSIVWHRGEMGLPIIFTHISDRTDFDVAATFDGVWKSYRSVLTEKTIWSNNQYSFPFGGGSQLEPTILEKYRSKGWALEIDERPHGNPWSIIFIDGKNPTKHPEYAEWFEWWK